MKKINLNADNLTNFLKKNAFLMIMILFGVILIFDVFFIYLQIRNEKIDPLKIISREQKIDQAAYDQVLARDKNKKTPSVNIDELTNPF
jgi:hypothetical protein